MRWLQHEDRLKPELQRMLSSTFGYEEFALPASTQLANLDDRLSGEQGIIRCVQFALRVASPARSQHERRRECRHPFPYPVRLQPVNAEGEHIAEPVVVLGKHIAKHGLDFYFTQPITHRRVVARFEGFPKAAVEILMDLTWCRFGEHGWYENGGRFLSAVTLPKGMLPEPADLLGGE